MKHRAQVSNFGRRPAARLALIRGLVISLVEHGRIQTTLAKAKELRRHVERAITLGKKNTLHARRLLLSRYPHPFTVEKILNQWSPHFATRNGGYTRIMRLGARIGDSAEMAIIELLDNRQFVIEDTPTDKTGAKKKASGKSAAKKKAPKKSASKAEGDETKKAKKSAKSKKDRRLS